MTRDLTSSRPVPAPITMVCAIKLKSNRTQLVHVQLHPDCRAMAIGARSQAARTYLEKFLNDLRVTSSPISIGIVVRIWWLSSVGVRVGGAGEARPEGTQGHLAQWGWYSRHFSFLGATFQPISHPQVDLTNKNVSIAIVGKDHPFTVYDDAGVDPYLAGIEGEERRWGCKKLD